MSEFDPVDYLKQSDGSTAIPSGIDPLDALLADRKRQRLSTQLLQSADPETIAKANALARESNLPVNVVESNLPQVQKSQAVDRFMRLGGKYPIIANWGQQDRNAAVAVDDVENLAKNAAFWRKWASKQGELRAPPPDETGFFSGLYRSLQTGYQGSLLAASDFLNSSFLNRDYRRAQSLRSGVSGQALLASQRDADISMQLRATDRAQDIERRATPQFESSTASALYAGLQSTARQAPALALSIATRNPAPSIAYASLDTASQAYAKYRTRGGTAGEAASGSALEGLIEGGFEALPMGVIVSKFGVTPVRKFIGEYLIKEGLTEQATTFAQDAVDTAIANPDKTWGDFLAERPDAAYRTAVATLVGSALIGGASEASMKFSTRQQQIEDAKADSEFLAGAAEIATESKTRTRDPQAFESLVAALSADTGAENLYIPADKVREYLQASDWDSVEFWREYDQDIADGTISNGDVVVPIGKAVAHLAGTPAWEALKGDMRLSPGGQSLNEAQETDENLPDEMSRLSDEVAARLEVERVAAEPRQRLFDSALRKLHEAGQTLSEATKNAMLVANRYATRAARLGRDVTGNEFDNVKVQQVLPAGLAPMVAADNLSLVVRAMRRGKTAKDVTGPSLLEWIASKGGIEDRGGDLKAMGADKWHKGKVGQKKLLRSFNRGQMSMLGSDGQQNSNSPDELAMRAWEAGYFPEFPERPSVNDLLDAIAEGVAGRDRYIPDALQPDGTDQMRVAAQDLYQLLDQAGLDPEKASETEIKEAVQRYQEQASRGQGFDQVAEGAQAAWERAVDKVVSGDWKNMRDIRVSALPSALRLMGMNESGVYISASKLATVRNKHKELPISVIKRLPSLIADPVSIFPSEKRDGSMVLAVEAVDRDGSPVLVPILARQSGDNVVMSIYGKKAGQAWIEQQIASAKADGLQVYQRDALAGAAPKSEAEASSSPAPIAAEGPARERKPILSLPDLVKQKQFDQSYSDGPRGRVTFDNGMAVIDLFQQRDLSTFIHEMGHVWLEELQADAALPEAPQQLRDDLQAVFDWFAANGHPVVDGVIPVEAHEMWARGIERYTLEGKAPSSALRRAFEAFRAWMLSIYHLADNLRSPITPEIRGVMDRLIATDEEIQQASEEQNLKALFDSVEAAAKFGMNEAAYKDYVKSATEAKDEAFDRLLFKTMETVRRERTKAYKDERDAVAADVRTSVDARPVFRALASLRAVNGLKLDKQWLINTYGEDVLASLPKGVPPIYKDGGVDADMIAEASGFSTGDEMVKALIGVEDRRASLREGGDKRSARDSIIDEETDAIMKERYGDPLSDGSIEEEALALIHNEKQGELQATELRVLSSKTKAETRATPYRIARLWAADKIRNGQVKDVASRAAIQRYLRAAAKAGKAAEQAYMAGDTDEAFKQKQAQMLNNALVAEAKQAADAIDIAVARMSRLAKRRTIKSMDQDYLERIHDLLESVDLKDRTQASIDRQGSFEEWRAEQEAKGHDIVTPPGFVESIGKTHWSRLTVEKLLGLDETVKQIAHLGRYKQQLIDNKVQREFDEVVAEAQAAIAMLPPKPPSDLMEPSRWDAVKSRVASMDASLLKMETVFDWLDSGDSNGVFNRIVFRPISDAQDREKAMLTDYTGRLTDLLKAIPKEQLKRWSEKVSLPELLNRETGNPWIMTREQLVSMALNMGNEGNIQRLVDGYGWNEEAVRRVLNRELTAADWQYVQGVWDTIDSLWPEIAAMERRVNGVEPDKVEAVPLVTEHGTLRGGYFPAIYDPRKSIEAEANAAKASDIFENIYTKATTRASSTKERSDKVKRPIHLSLSVINRHVGEVIHDITHREAIMQADKFLASKRIMKAVDETLGPEVRKQFRPWLQHIANEWANDRKGVAGWDAFAKKLRTNTSIVGMGFRLSTIIMQVAGYSNSFEKVGAKWVAPQLAKAVDPRAYRFVMERSSEVRNRMDTLERDVRENVKQLAGRTDLIANARKFAFYGIGYMDRVVVIPTWLGAYNRGISEGMSEADAGYYADKAVRQSQGAGAAKDLAAVQRSNEWMRLATMFYSYQSAIYQRFRSLGRDARTAGVRDVPDLIARSFWLIVVPPLLSELLAGRGPDDDEDWGMWAFQKMLAGLFGPIPIARDVVNAAQSGFGYSFTPAARAFETGLNVKTDLGNLWEGDDTKRATRNALELSGYTLGLPTGQLASSTQFIVDVSEGEQDPQTITDWMEGLSKGKLSDN